MVGVPRSKGCATCRKRRIKCDETRPSCSQCRRGGRSCPGYERAMKFVNEGRRFQRNPLPVVYPASLSSIQPSHDGQHRVQLVSTFVQDLFPLHHGRRQHSFIGGWLWLVPTVLQHSPYLDLAAEAVALGYFGKQSKSRDTLVRSYSVYTNALRVLSKAIQHPKECLSSETLCAVLLLLQYERFVSIEGNSWYSHASGIRKLIQLRGPERHRLGIDHAILMASRGYIIAEALLTGEACFLEDKAWKGVQFAATDSPLAPENFEFFHEGLNYFASVPGLLQRARSCQEQNEVEQFSISSEAINLRTNIMYWHQGLEYASKEPLRCISVTETSLHNIGGNYEYRDTMTATFTVNYCANLILINQALDWLNHTTLYVEENNVLAKDIANSTAYCSKSGFCGIQAIALALPIALTAAAKQDEDIIGNCMQALKISAQATGLRSIVTNVR
ncbi:hypothetical protein GQ44DRAFT_702087 [Phaeosphaeriaceae sp. PMI808]|nr:hypothetical protein GQ44DRAFT_702087 [Phaeosphaeriaceae sp. PMI808]